MNDFIADRIATALERIADQLEFSPDTDEFNLHDRLIQISTSIDDLLINK